MEMDHMDSQIIQIMEMIAAVVAAVIAYWQRSQKIAAENESRQLVAFFDPKDNSVTTPPASVPARSWKMNEETKRWVLQGHDALNQASLSKQIESAEVRQLLHYYLTYEDRGGGYYEIEYGLMKGSGVGDPPGGE
jgi:hypothetical protein